MARGTRLKHIVIRHQDKIFLDALAAQRLPDPTTSGDFCRRFTAADIDRLTDAINQTRLRVWKEQPPDFFEHAYIDADGTLAPTDGWCKQGIDIAYNSTWGYHPLLVSLANTAEPLGLVNRSGNRPSHGDAHLALDKAVALCRQAGFRRITLRGDTDFTQTKHLDRWDAENVGFVFGIDARANLKALADDLPADAYSVLERPTRSPVKTTPRGSRTDHKTPIVVARQYETIRLKGEEVAEFAYRPVACQQAYRVVVLRKRLSREKGQQRLFEEYRYFFYLTNDRTPSAAEIVLLANDRCDQENLIAQLKGGVKAMTNPVDTLVSNGAYMVMASLAWSLKVWAALLVPVSSRWEEKHRAEKRTLLRMEFATFYVALIQMPCQIVRTGRRTCIDSCPGTRGKECSSAWWIDSTVGGYVDAWEGLKPGSGCSGPYWLRDRERRSRDETRKYEARKAGRASPGRATVHTRPDEKNTVNLRSHHACLRANESRISGASPNTSQLRNSYPCCRGSVSLTPTGRRSTVPRLSFNPCCRGSVSLTSRLFP